MTYEECLYFLYNSLPVFQHIGAGAYKAGLDNIIALEELLGNPHKKFRSIHIAGTNGKGSVSHMTASVLMAEGYRTGLFTSPHLIDFRERIRIDGQMIPKSYVVNFVEQHMEAIERIKPSFFEITSAIAFDYFASKGVDIAVIEVGMGGRLDSTNVIRPLVSVITNISLDHTQFLGDTLELIAAEKGGIIKEMTPVVVGESHIETQLTFISIAKQMGSPILFADQTYRVLAQSCGDDIDKGAAETSVRLAEVALKATKSATKESGAVGDKEVVDICAKGTDIQRFLIENRLNGFQFELQIDLLGGYQRKNILTTITLLDTLNGAGGMPISTEAVQNGLRHAAASTSLMGRWQVVNRNPIIVCDTGHNEAGIRNVVAQIAKQQYKKLYLILGFVADKELSKVLSLMPKNAHYILTRADIPRALDEKVLAQMASDHGLTYQTAATVSQAVAMAQKQATPQDMIFVGGSTFIVAEALPILSYTPLSAE